MRIAGSVTLHPRAERRLLAGGMWFTQKDIKRVNVTQDVALVRVSGKNLPDGVLGLWEKEGTVPLRVFDVNVDGDLEGVVRKKIMNALTRRRRLGVTEWGSFRLINAEGDMFPGVVVDVYEDFFVCLFHSEAAATFADIIQDTLSSLLHLRHFVFRKGSRVVKRSPGFHSPITLAVDGIQYTVDFAEGHKTGFYLDQRHARRYLTSIAEGKSVLDCFSYNGAFALHAVAGGACSAVCVESSAELCNMIRKNAGLNGFSHIRVIHGNVFDVLNHLNNEKAKFDIVIMDPPAFAPDRSSKIPAVQAYRRLHHLALQLLNDGGLLFSFSCSYHVTLEDLVKSLPPSSKRWIVYRSFTQPEDHPYVASVPATHYLKGLLAGIES